MGRRWRTPAALLGALLAIAACSEGGTSDDDAAPSTTARPATTATTTIHATTTTRATTTTSARTTTTSSTTTTDGTTTTSTLAPCGDVAVGLTELTLTAGGADHPVRIFVPSSFAGQRLPTVLDWHGLGSDGFQETVLTGYEGLAETEGFIVVHATGVPGPQDDSNSWELADGQDPTRDDLAFADALMDRLVAEWCADPTRIYSTGMSNGGYFTARLVCERADRIAAAVSVAGTYHPDGCTPARSVPYLAFHGTADAVVPYHGGGQSVLNTGNDPELRVFFEQVMPDEFAEFAADAGCSPEPTATPVGQDVIRHDYGGYADGTPMTFFEVTNGGHTWPGSPIADAIAALGYTTKDVNATVDGWAFLEQHALPD